MVYHMFSDRHYLSKMTRVDGPKQESAEQTPDMPVKDRHEYPYIGDFPPKDDKKDIYL